MDREVNIFGKSVKISEYLGENIRENFEEKISENSDNEDSKIE